MIRQSTMDSNKNTDSFLLKRQIRLLLVFLAALFVGIVFDYFPLVIKSNELDIEHFQKVFNEKEKQLSEILNSVARDLENTSQAEWLLELAPRLESKLSKHKFVLLIFNQDQIIYWSDNFLQIEQLADTPHVDGTMVFPGNTWCYTKKINQSGIEIVGLINIKQEYLYENNILHNAFVPGFDVHPSVELFFNEDETKNAIFDNKGNFLFNLSDKNAVRQESQPLIPSILYAVAILALLVFFTHSFSQRYARTNQINWIRAFVVFLVVARYIMMKLQFPAVFYQFELFNPQHFGKSPLFSSLGDFLINSVFILILVYLLCRNNILSNTIKKAKTLSAYLLVSGLLIVTYIFFISTDNLIESLITNSTINFELNRIFTISQFSLIGYLIISFLLFSFALLADKVIKYTIDVFPQKIFLTVAPSIWILLFVLTFSVDNSQSMYSFLFFLIFMVSAAIIRYKQWKLNYSTLIFFLLIVSMYATLRITNVVEAKEQEIKKVMAVSLATERDPLAETFLDNIYRQLLTDPELIAKLFFAEHQSVTLNDYVRKEYFSAYWNKYDMQLFVCGPTDSILLENNNELHACREFFDEMIAQSGINVPGTDFYFLDNLNGRISYVGELNYYHPVDSSRLSLFIDLNSKLQKQILGYPELLIKENIVDNSTVPGYSYAKFKDGVLVTQSGEYEYSLSNSIYHVLDKEFTFLELDGFEHLIYRIDEDSMILVSNPARSLLEFLMLLSYIFVLFHLIFTLVMFFYRFPDQLIEFRFGFKNKIQISMVSVVLLSLVLIGTGTIYFNIKQYNAKHYENISEKIQSVLVELEHKLANEQILDSDIQEYLTYLLIKFSNVFYTDINMYDLNGDLLASSRPGIFGNALISTKMNTEAYRQIHLKQKAKFIQEEKISKLEFLSAYVPFTNNQNQVLAYLNLPYFAKQKLLKKEISSLITAVINIYVLLILLTILITVFITNKITRPLQLIQEKMGKLRLGRPSEKIIYQSHDEIGNLINDYNRMVEELQKSAGLLAKSERESAWREMAKQIAHEIKNPLTPMRLHLQHLQKTIHENPPDLKERFRKVADILITQIDVLSSIATEFSKFAQMPKAKNQHIDLCLVLQKVCGLFAKEDIKISLNCNETTDAFVYSDYEQLYSVFINLVKNGIQAVPEGNRPEITIDMQKSADNLLVEITDNGTGITTDIQEKLFQPSFTTKSSGMGLGLAIAKSTIESAGGKIWFRTTEGYGSSFFVELPVVKSRYLEPL